MMNVKYNRFVRVKRCVSAWLISSSDPKIYDPEVAFIGVDALLHEARESAVSTPLLLSSEY